MESRDLKGVRRAFDILRKTTRLIQVIPFIYLGIFSLALLTERLMPSSMVLTINSVLGVSPYIIGIVLALSKLLKLCVWHKVACLFPLIQQGFYYIDNFVITFTQGEVVLINTTMGILSLIFLLAAIRHFFYGHKAAAQGTV